MSLDVEKNQSKRYTTCSDVVGEGGFEPPKLEAADLQSVPFGHSGTPPYTELRKRKLIL